MRSFLVIMPMIFVWPLVAEADVNKRVAPLPCGIYDQKARPFIHKDLATQSPNTAAYTMAITTTGGKKLSVEVKNVEIRLQGERNNVSVFLDGKPFAKTSHQDLPLYLEVHVENTKYRIICDRMPPMDENETGFDTQQERLSTK